MMFLLAYSKYYVPFLTIVVWYVVFRQFDLPWSTVLFCPPVMYLIYQILDFSATTDIPHNGNLAGEEARTNSVAQSIQAASATSQEGLMEDVHSFRKFFSSFLPHAKNLYFAIFCPRKMQQKAAGSEEVSDVVATDQSAAEEKSTAGKAQRKESSADSAKFQKTEMAMNLFKRVYIAFTQGKALRPKDSAFQRFCWAVFSNKEDFVSFIEVVSESNENAGTESVVVDSATESRTASSSGPTTTDESSATHGPAMETPCPDIDVDISKNGTQSKVLHADFKKQAYFLWGFVQADFIDYDLSLTAEFPHIKIRYADQLLADICQISDQGKSRYKMVLYQAPSESVSIEMDDIRQVRRYNAVIKFVLDSYLSGKGKAAPIH